MGAASFVKLKSLAFLAFFLIGIFPLAASIIINRPKVVDALEQSAEDRLRYELTERFAVLRREMERNREALRMFALLPGPLELVEQGDGRAAGGGLPREQLRQRIGGLVNRGFVARKEMLAITIVGGDGQELFRVLRGKDGGFVMAPEAGRRKDGGEGVSEQSFGARPGEVFVMREASSDIPAAVQSTVRLGVVLHNPTSGARGLLIFTLDLRGLLPGLDGFDLVDQDGVCLIAAPQGSKPDTHGTGHVFADFSQLANRMEGDRPVILRHASGESYGWLPLFDADPVTRYRLWVVQPVDHSVRDVWLDHFRRNIIMIAGMLMTLVAGLSLLLARYVDRFRAQFMAGVAALLREEKRPVLGWRWPEELARLGCDLDRLAEIHLGNTAGRREAEQHLAHELAVKEAMVELSAQLLGASSDVATVADRVVEAAKRLTGSPHGYVGTIEPLRHALVIHTLSGMMGPSCQLGDRDAIKEFALGPDGQYPGLWGFSLNEEKSFFTNAPALHPASVGCPEGHLPLRRFLAVPVLLAGELVGQIAVANASRDYSERDVAALERLADHFAQAIKGLRLSTERDRLRVDLQQAQKMEAIGTLAGGVAHDFNNMLTPILGYTELAMVRLPADDKLRHDLGEIRKAAQRAKSLVQQILAFSRQKPQELIPLDLTPLLKETMKLLRAALPATIEFKMDIRPDCGRIMADPTQMQQVLVNLSTNASHAMEEQGGVLGIGLEEISFSGAGGQPALESMRAGRYLLLRVSDTGCGIERAVMERIFEPYFTTKEQGKGTGMGLALVHGIVKSHGGHITVDSEPGNGTVFRVYLPVVASVPVVSAGVVAVSLPRGTERVLLVDDEETVVAMHQEMLSFLGYQVTSVANGIAACELFQANPDAFDLVVSDQNMPGMTGDVLAARLLAIRPELPMVICTGFSETLTEEKAKEIGIRGYVMKPVVIGELAATLRRALGAGGMTDERAR